MDMTGLLRPPEAAEYLGVAVQTLARWRSEKRVLPRWTKIGGAVRYRRDWLDEFVSANESGIGTSPNGSA